MGESMSEGVLPGLRPVRGKGPSTGTLTPALSGVFQLHLAEEAQGAQRGQGLSVEPAKAGGFVVRRSVCLQALSTEPHHSSPPSARQPLSSPGLRGSEEEQAGKGHRGSYPWKSDLLLPLEWDGGEVCEPSRQRSTTQL